MEIVERIEKLENRVEELIGIVSKFMEASYLEIKELKEVKGI